MSRDTELAEAQRELAYHQRHKRLWRALRLAAVVVLLLFLALVGAYGGMALARPADAWMLPYLAGGVVFLAFLLVLVARHRATDRMLDEEIAKAARRVRELS
ncbi:hypothetical protein [Azospirillum sp.]|uniref:hypothetical protein n=1 Tax=Azospirillum sp. TaxID=34012 RepID=UPI002D447A20|nr:hypothetical protein [Azospirillum sp.]HYD70173.1 hypothetical protein [Azospirillum sp.]